jgi:predicted nucleic acid-binding protein
MGPDSVRLVGELVERYPKPQLNDLFALVLAIELKAFLATGDEHLRQAALAEGVRVVRTLGILQMLVDEGIVSGERVADGLEAILDKGDRWLPAAECRRCLERWRGL